MQDAITVALLIPALPLCGFLLLIFWGRMAPRAFATATTVALAVSTVLASWLFFNTDAETSISASKLWFAVGDYKFNLGLLVDPLSTTMAAVVTFMSLRVHIYSFGYMKGHKRFSTFYAFLALFTASMLTLVLASNFMLLFIAWEGVGFCSYFLIGFYFDKHSAAAAGKKAFVATPYRRPRLPYRPPCASSLRFRRAHVSASRNTPGAQTFRH
ncbi:MAG: proton-conducting transporter membrane subunit [Planctomycetota bacterium]|nr:proton-conducting transporter membrane subunit [Planctomycetota bacterium]